MFINYRCAFLQSKKSSEEIARYIQSYEGFVGVTVMYNSPFFFLKLAFDYLISDLEGGGSFCFFFGHRLYFSYFLLSYPYFSSGRMKKIAFSC